MAPRPAPVPARPPVAPPPSAPVSPPETSIQIWGNNNRPALAPVAFWQGEGADAKLYVSSSHDNSGIVKYVSAQDGSAIYAQWDKKEKRFIPCQFDASKKEGENLVPLTNLKPMTELFDAIIELDELDKKDPTLLALESGDKTQIQATLKKEGWAVFANTDKTLSLTHPSGANATYFLSDDGKKWSTVRPKWFFAQLEAAEKAKNPKAPYKENTLYAYRVHLRDGKGYRAGAKVKEVLEACNADVYYDVLDAQNPKSKVSYRYKHLTGYGSPPPSASGSTFRACGVYGSVSLPRKTNADIAQLQWIGLGIPNLTSPMHENVQLEFGVHGSNAGVEGVLFLAGSDVNLPSTRIGNEEQQSSGSVVRFGGGVVNRSGEPGENKKLRISETRFATLSFGVALLTSATGEKVAIPGFFFNNDNNFIEGRIPVGGGKEIPLAVQVRAQSFLPLTTGGPQNPSQPGPQGDVIDLIKNRSGFHLGVRTGFDARAGVNASGLEDPNKIPTPAQLASRGIYNGVNLLGLIVGNGSDQEFAAKRRSADEGTFTQIGVLVPLSGALGALTVQGPQDFEDGLLAKQLGAKGGAGLLVGKLATAGVLFAVGAPVAYKSDEERGYPDAQGDVHAPRENYFDRLRASLVSTGIQEGVGALTSAVYFVTPHYTRTDPASIAGGVVRDVVLLGGGLLMGLAPKIFIGQYDSTPGTLRNSQIGQPQNDQLDPFFMNQQTLLSGVSTGGFRVMGAVLANVQRQAAHARRQATRAQIEAGLEKTTVRSTGADGLPVKDVEATLDGNAHGVLLGAQGKGNVEFLAAPTSARPRGSLDTQENRDAHELEQATTRLAELRGRLAGLTRDRGANDLGYMALPTVVNGQVLQGRQANPHAVQEEIKKLEARIAELRAKRAAREELASQEAPAKDSVRLASAK